MKFAPPKKKGNAKRTREHGMELDQIGRTGQIRHPDGPERFDIVFQLLIFSC